MLRGRVLRFDELRGYGFIAPDNGGEDVFVHANTVGDYKHSLLPGTPVEFEATESDRGLKALTVRVLPASGAPAVVAEPARVATGVERPAGEGADDEDGLCDVLSPAAFRQEVTELMLDTVPSLTGGQVTQLRQVLLGLAQRHGWVES